MPNTDYLQVMPDFFSSKEEGRAAQRHNTNPRYKFFRQTHFTAGDYEQFLEFWDKSSHRVVIAPRIDREFPSIYKNISVDDIIHTFEYIFHKFKKGIFVKIIDNEIKTFLPFSKIDYMNEWSDRIRVDPAKYPNGIFSMLAQCSDKSTYDPSKIHFMMDHWYANNGLLRYEYPISENDSGVSTIRDMLMTLARERRIPDCEFFINKRDFPILRRDGRESYDAIFGMDTPLLSHQYDRYCPILGMTTTKDHADIPIPTWDDWARVSFPEKWFGKDFIEYPNIECGRTFQEKIPTAVFRGASTGLGIDPATNPRLFYSLLSMEGRRDEDGHLFLDCGITKWNCRPRCINQGYYDTIDSCWRKKIPLVPFKSYSEQAEYRYILHLPGHSEAYRLSMELAMGSVILLYPCRYRLWYQDELQPYIHYIPIDPSDPEDIFIKIRWCKTHDTECQRIAENARRFYEDRLSRDAILDHMCEMLCALQQHTGLIEFAKNDMRDFQMSLQKESLRIEKMILQNRIFTSLIPDLENDLSHLQHRTFQVLLYQIPPEVILEKIRKASIIKQSRSMELRQITLFNRRLCVKTPMHIAEKNLIHECFIGQIGMNRIANVCPFVVYTYGRWENHIISDMVEGKTLEMMLQEFPADKVLSFFISILQQLSLILHFLQNDYGFIHYDCYPWNIMISPNRSQKIFRFPLETRTVEFCPEYYPVLIDFGKSHILYQNSHFVNVSPFHLHLHQDIISILICGLFIILHHQKIPRAHINRVVHLINYLGRTSFTGFKTFEHINQIKVFLRVKKKYSNILLNDKNDYKEFPPIRFFYAFPSTQFRIIDRIDELYVNIETQYARSFILYQLSQLNGKTPPVDIFILSRQKMNHNPIHTLFRYYINFSLCNLIGHDTTSIRRQIESMCCQEWIFPPCAEITIHCELPRFFSHPDFQKIQKLPKKISTNHFFERHKILMICLHACQTVGIEKELSKNLQDYTLSILDKNRYHSILGHYSRYWEWCSENK
jgi:hypothetical protein